MLQKEGVDLHETVIVIGILLVLLQDLVELLERVAVRVLDLLQPLLGLLDSHGPHRLLCLNN